MAKDTGTQLVATNDAHYVEKEDSYVQRVLTCIATNTTLDDKNSMQFATDEFYLKSEDEMKALGFPQSAYDNTVKLRKSAMSASHSDILSCRFSRRKAMTTTKYT